MDNMSNGSVILLSQAINDQESVVLAMTETDFVTWMVNDSGDAFSGHYHHRTLAGLTDVLRDFRNRSGPYPATTIAA